MMEETQLISIDEFCTIHEVEISFISSLEQSGLIQVIRVKENDFIQSDVLYQLEKFVRLHYDLDINIEGIETINHLLQRVSDMQDELTFLRNRLRFYESE